MYPYSSENAVESAGQQAVVDLFKMITFDVACNIADTLSTST